MIRMKYLIVFGTFLMIIFLLTFNSTLAAVTIPTQPIPGCNDYIAAILEQNQTIDNLTKELDKCKNESSYYKNLYESANAGVTNKELIEIHQNLTVINNNISNLYQKMGDVENNFNVNLTIGLGVTIFSLTILEIAINLHKRKRKSNVEK